MASWLVPHFEPMLWSVWFVIILVRGFSFFCALWWVHIPRTTVGVVKKLRSPARKW